MPHRDHATDDRSATPWILLVYFGSGACSLIDEVVWVRLLKLTLGNTVYASGIVVAVFMGGLALGSWLMGRHADRVRRPLRLYALLELGVTLSAVAVPLFLVGADRLYRWLFLRIEPSPPLLLVLQALVSAVLLLVPIVLMGTTLPLLARHVAPMADRAGRLVGRLYAVNMFGAVAGCYLAGFHLIRIVGVMGTLYTAAGINLLVALGGWTLSRRVPRAVFPPATAQARPRPDRASDGGGLGHRILVTAVFASGLVSIGYEIVWLRSLGLLAGGYTHVFSAVLTVYLLGNVIGAWVASRLARRASRPASAYGWSLTCLGLLGIAHVSWTGRWYADLAPVVSDPAAGMPASPFLHAVAMFLLPAIVVGFGFPLALQAWASERGVVGRTTGVMYAVNTLGAVLGGLLTSFLLIPALGLQASVMLLGLIAGWSGVLVIVTAPARARFLARSTAILAGIGLSVSALAVPADGFERRFVSALDGEVLAVTEGATTTVAVIAQEAGVRLTSDNNIIAGDGDDRSAQKTLGHLGMLLHPDARKVLSVGFGGGETTACLARYDLARIDCVEVAPELVEVALEHFDHINLGDRLDQSVEMHYMDAGNYLHLTDRKYDLIINDANNHDLSGSAPLFTRDHFRSALEHLEPGGLVISKLHYRDHPRSSLESVLGTFADAFPHVTIWFPVTKPYAMFYLVGSREEQRSSPERIDALLDRPAIRDSVAYLNWRSSHDVLSCYLGDQLDVSRHLGSFRLNTEQRPFVELNRLRETHAIGQSFFGDLVAGIRRGAEIARAKAAAKAAVRHAPSCAKAHENLAQLSFQDRPDEALAHFERAVALMPDDAELHFNYGIALSLRGRRSDAIAAVRRGLLLRPRNAQGQALLARLRSSG